MIAVITGTTGLVGSLLFTKLLSDPTITQVISVTRKSLNQSHPKLKEVLVSDFSNLLDYKNEIAGDIYFCALGTTIKTAGSKENFRKVDFDAIVNFGKVAKLNQAKSLTVVSANMANAVSSIFYNKVKGETEEALIKMQISSLNIFRPGLLIGERSEKRVAEKIFINVFNALSLILPQKLEKSLGTQIETLTNRMLTEGKKHTSGVHIILPENI